MAQLAANPKVGGPVPAGPRSKPLVAKFFGIKNNRVGGLEPKGFSRRVGPRQIHWAQSASEERVLALFGSMDGPLVRYNHVGKLEIGDRLGVFLRKIFSS